MTEERSKRRKLLPEINAKSSQNIFETYKFGSFDKLMKKTEKKYKIVSKKLNVG